MPSFEELFVEPVLRNGFFNEGNTALFAVILIAAVYIVYRLLAKLHVPIDRHFAIAVIPYIIWATSFRVLRDLSVKTARMAAEQTGSIGRFNSDVFYQFSQIQQASMERVLGVVPHNGFADFYSSINAIFLTPLGGMSYIVTFIFAFSLFLFSFALSKMLRKRGLKMEYWKLMIIPPLALSALNFALLPITELFIPLLILGMTALATGITYSLIFLLRKRISISSLLDWRNQGIMAAHFLDASATYFAIKFLGYGEQHFLPRFLFEAVGPWAFFLLKPAVVLPALWVIDRDKSDRDFSNFLKIAIFILGASPGLRSLIRLAVGGGV